MSWSRPSTFPIFAGEQGGVRVDSEGKTVLRVKALSKVYQTGDVVVSALRSVDFQASAGEFVVILGP